MPGWQFKKLGNQSLSPHSTAPGLGCHSGQQGWGRGSVGSPGWQQCFFLWGYMEIRFRTKSGMQSLEELHQIWLLSILKQDSRWGERVICFWCLWQGFGYVHFESSSFLADRELDMTSNICSVRNVTQNYRHFQVEPQTFSGGNSRSWWTDGDSSGLSTVSTFPSARRTLAMERDPSYRTDITEQWKYPFIFSKLTVSVNLNPIPLPPNLEDIAKHLVPEESFLYASPVCLHFHWVSAHILS